jgi:aryl-alcohol dehydrogenase-like predicted oxidoreductase
VATKVGYVSAVPKVLQADFDQSRQRLQMDHVDVLYLHRYPPDAALEGVLDCLAEMHQRGLFSYLGLSNFAAWQVMKTVAMARDRGLTVDILQPMYSLVKRQAEVEILPMCADQGIAVAPYSPLGGGLLTGKYQSGGDGRLTQDHRYAARYAPDWMQAVASGLGEIARELAVHPATLAAAWAARHEAGPMPILSARNAEQLLPSLEAVNYDMDDALYARLTALSPTPAPATDRLEEA